MPQLKSSRPVWFVLIAYTLLVFWSALTVPSPKLAGLLGQYDKHLHFAEYALLYALTVPAFLRSPLIRVGHLAGWAYAYALLVGALTETLQRFVPGRGTDLVDWFADATGALWAILFYALCRKHLPRELFKPANGGAAV